MIPLPYRIFNRALVGALEKSKHGLNGKPGILTTTGDRTAVFED